MPTDPIAVAKQRMAEAATRKQKALTEAAQAGREEAELAAFVKMAHSLVAGADSNGKPKGSRKSSPTKPPNAAGAPQVLRGSYLGAVVEVLREKGPMTLQAIADAVKANGVGKELDDRKVYINVNSAIWRRQDDLFKKTNDGLVHLKAQHVEIVDELKRQKRSGEKPSRTSPN